MLIDVMDLESCTEIEEVLALCVKPMKRLMTDAEQDEIKFIVHEDDLEETNSIINKFGQNRK